MAAEEGKEPMALQSSLQNYTWGKLGTESKASEFYALNNPEFVPEINKPYAELWLGTHPKGPSLIKKTGESLEDWINKRPEVLGDVVVKKFGSKLPFLLKILSIRKPLSIQAHPDKLLAERLHKLSPEIYKDDNHKPEMFLALSNASSMCGFRPKAEIVEFIKTVPELNPLLPENALSTLMESEEDVPKQVLMNIFSIMITSPKDLVRQQIAMLKARLEKCCSCGALEGVLIGLINEYPEDVGVFCPYLLNVLHLSPGEAVFLAANEPHSYISGDGVECMASSDNVVRAGLTDKFIDKETLISMLSYKCRTPDEVKICGIKETEFNVVFKPPVEDFAVAVFDIPPRNVEFKLPRRQSVSILMVIEGDAEGNDLYLKKGDAYLLHADFELSVSQLEQNPRLYMFQAFVNV